MKPVRYLCSLIAGASISLALLLIASDLTTPAAAVDDPDPFAWIQQPELITEQPPQRYDDGVVCRAGASVDPPQAAVTPRAVTVCRTIQVQRGSGWWTRGPVRRVVSWPVRRIAARRCR